MCRTSFLSVAHEMDVVVVACDSKSSVPQAARAVPVCLRTAVRTCCTDSPMKVPVCATPCGACHTTPPFCLVLGPQPQVSAKKERERTSRGGNQSNHLQLNWRVPALTRRQMRLWRTPVNLRAEEAWTEKRSARNEWQGWLARLVRATAQKQPRLAR